MLGEARLVAVSMQVCLVAARTRDLTGPSDVSYSKSKSCETGT